MSPVTQQPTSRVHNFHFTGFTLSQILSKFLSSHYKNIKSGFYYFNGDRGSTVVKVLCYKSEGRWFDPS